MITRREAKDIVDWVISELNRKSFAYSTDGKLDFSKGGYGGGTISGTPGYGGDIAEGAIWNRHVHSAADIQGTKIRVATEAERGTVRLASNLETGHGIAIQPNDSRIHNNAVSDATEHDIRYFTQTQLLSGVLDFYYDGRYYTQDFLNLEGATVVGVKDEHDVFGGSTVEEVLYELLLKLGAQAVVDLIDTPQEYPNSWVPWYGKLLAVNRECDALEWKPRDYVDGGRFTDGYEGATNSKRTYVDGGSFTGYEIINGGTF